MKFYALVPLFFMLFLAKAYSQNAGCPENIGFENGTLQNWQCYIGSISRAGVTTVSASQPVVGRHTIFKYAANQLDPYGKFPVTCPNGSLYSIKLGNDNTGAQAERVSYTFTVPNNQTYSIIYNYAVVFQNPSHADFEQPKFTARVFDVASNKYIDCGSFEFVASSGLPGFQQANNNVFYKPWAPITINLFGYAGKTLRLEFTTNDCTVGGHFGYAYIDVNENCASPITGETYCAGNSFVKLAAPAGFKEYYWYKTGDFSQVLGNSNILTLTPAPPDLSQYALRIVPFPGLGCEDTLYTTIHASPDILTLNVKTSISGCESGISLKDPSITAGSSPNLTYTYFNDPNGTDYVPDPEHIVKSGTYYIKAVNAPGCIDIKPIDVRLDNSPSLIITDPDPVCAPQKVDITQTKITAGSSAALTYYYWKDKDATKPITSPQAIDSVGTYYIQGINSLGCPSIAPVKVVIESVPSLLVKNNITACLNANLTDPLITQGSHSNLIFSYWADSSATQALAAPEKVTISGTYYIKASNTAGCYEIKPVNVRIYPLPTFKLTASITVVFPATVDLTRAYTGSDSLTYTYWKDLAATIAVDDAAQVNKTGIYYIKASSKAGCTLILPVVVTIDPPAVVKIIAPNVFTPNNDGTNDLFKISYEGAFQVSSFKIYNRYGQQVFETKQLTDYWNGLYNGSKAPLGTYYWVLEGQDTYRRERVLRSGSITIIR